MPATGSIRQDDFVQSIADALQHISGSSTARRMYSAKSTGIAPTTNISRRAKGVRRS